MPSANDTPAADETPKKGKRWLIPVVVAVLAGSAGAAAFTQNDALRQSVGLAADSTAAEAEAPVEYGEFFEMPGIVVNPRGTDGRRYFMVKVGVEAKEMETLDRLDVLGPAATDAVIDLMSKQGVEELSDISRRDSLKEAIRTRFNDLLGDDGPVSRIYFTQYVLQ